MTARDWHADREAVFDRDARTCRHCGTADDTEALRAYPVGDVALEGEVHESALVTVCADCFGTLSDSPSATPTGAEELFHHVRETTRIQGETISTVASFASVATALPGDLESALDDEGEDAALEESIAQYRRHRRDVLLAIAVVDARLERLAALEGDADEPAAADALEAFSETATDLQSALREVVTLSETVATGLDRCHGCFDALESGPTCDTCGLAVRETADWEDDDGTLAFDRLFATINDRLQEASATTETLTDRTTTLAERLTAA
ncbi:HNH endonuclease [Natrinema sp. H-ect1]|uniref:HNH endonuclease n=1 Tax=Natrinema sp. H-ect1 TaxID=3242700 RepID=UPI00359E2C0C